MAWPCISRVCCLARFWNHLDKSDLSVPLTIQNYSDITEQEVRTVSRPVSPPGNKVSAPDAPAPGSRGRKEPSYKPREDYHPPGVPFPSITQYKQDFKPWPIPRKDNFPWISNGSGRADSPGNSSHRRGRREERCGVQRWGEKQEMEERKTSSYRQEFKPWMGVRSAKSVRRNLPAPGTEATRVLCETSYQAAYSGEAQRSTGPGEPVIPSVRPPAGPQIVPTALRASGTSSSSRAAKGEEHLMKTKLSPNPSAIFQSGSGIVNM
ncbi:microtubule-associated protein 6 homolog [Antennarius striatus]|uniref:microtubule-associated protein 6 homolog n=1 Tax=Antennarius striatus TaxID=241820 RepID=UPI0035B01D8C